MHNLWTALIYNIRLRISVDIEAFYLLFWFYLRVLFLLIGTIDNLIQEVLSFLISIFSFHIFS